MSTGSVMLDDLFAKAAAAAGRPVEVEQTLDGRYIVEWFSFDRKPPPKGDSIEEALQGFIDYLLTLPKDPAILPTDKPNQENTHGK